jgi:8-oxo-dGTP pyrophosphatase MutT (NUDIX family)
MIMWRKPLTRFDTSNRRFGFRVAGVMLHERSVLLQGEPQGAFWTLPGGGVELLEPSDEALKREMQEELGVDIRLERLLCVVKHFFVSDDDGKAIHELGFYFLITPLDAPYLYELEHTFQAVEGERDIIFQWFKLDDLTTITLYPSFLPAALRSLPLTPEHMRLTGN